MPIAIMTQPQRVKYCLTLTVKEHVATPPHAFVAVQVTVVLPSGKTLPEGGEQTTGPVLPGAVTLKLAMALPVHVSSTMFCGQVIEREGEFTRNGSTHPLLAPKQRRNETVTGWRPGPTIVPAGGNCVNCRVPQLVLPPETQKELVSNERLGMTPEQPLVVSSERM